MTFTKKALAISTGPDTHLDHLGVLAALLKIPLIVTEEKSFELAQIFYPEANVQFLEPEELTLDYLAQECDMLLHCGKFWLMELQPFFERFYNKKMQFVLCPHGNSDKGHSLQGREAHATQDILLVYGDQMLDLLKKTDALAKVQKTIRTGNYRYPIYRKHQKFYDKLAEERVFAHFDRNRKTILYAPTWENSENPSLFFEICSELVERLAPSYNLIIKLHPLMEQEEPARLTLLKDRHAHLSNALFLSHFPALYPLLARADIYLGDFSAVGYDFLAFDRPMYFFSRNKKLPLHNCGMSIGPKEVSYLDTYLKSTLEENQKNFSDARKKTYAYAFGSERRPSDLKVEIYS